MIKTVQTERLSKPRGPVTREKRDDYMVRGGQEQEVYKLKNVGIKLTSERL